MNADPAPIFAALGDSTRLALLQELSDGTPRSIAALAEGRALTRQAVTKHLRVLENVGLVAASKVGRETRFAFRDAPIGEIAAYLDQVAGQWDVVLDRLRSHIENPPR